jgi:hypothetical protein
MKLTILASALALCGGIALAQNPGTQQPGKSAMDQAKKDHKMSAEVVSADSTAQQITVRKLTMGSKTSTGSASSAQLPPPADAPTFTLKVEGKALTRLSSVKPGDQVTISCRALGAGAPADTSAGSGMGTITSQAMADAHCSSVTDISAAKTNP